MRALERLAALTLAAGALSSCIGLPSPAFDGLREEHFVRIDAEHDVVEWISIKHELVGGDDAVEALRGVLAGRRVFPPGGGWLSLDLDEWHDDPVDAESAEEPGEAPLAEVSPATRVHELAPGVSIVEVALGLEGKDTLALWRRTHIEHASEWVRLARDDVLRIDSREYEQLERFPVFDARTLELALRAQEQGEDFWTFRGDSLVFEMPMTSANAARCVAHVVDAAAADGGQLVASFWRNLRELELHGERARARFGPDASGWIALAPGPSKPEQPHFLRESVLREAGLAVEPAERFAARRSAAGLP